MHPKALYSKFVRTVYGVKPRCLLMKKTLLLMIMMLVLAGLALADDHVTQPVALTEGPGLEICRQLLDNHDFLGIELPAYMPFRTERFNIYTFDGEAVGLVELQDKAVTTVECATYEEEYTYDVYIKDYETVDMLFVTDDPLGVYKQHLKDDNIKIEGKTFGKKLQYFFFSVG